MVSPSQENLLSLEDAAVVVRKMRKDGRKVHVNTIRRWINEGMRGIHLERFKVGGPCLTSEEAIIRFFQRLSEPQPQHTPPARVPSMASLAAEANLIAQGI